MTECGSTSTHSTETTAVPFPKLHIPYSARDIATFCIDERGESCKFPRHRFYVQEYVAYWCFFPQKFFVISRMEAKFCHGHGSDAGILPPVPPKHEPRFQNLAL